MNSEREMAHGFMPCRKVFIAALRRGESNMRTAAGLSQDVCVNGYCTRVGEGVLRLDDGTGSADIVIADTAMRRAVSFGIATCHCVLQQTPLGTYFVLQGASLPSGVPAAVMSHPDVPRLAVTAIHVCDPPIGAAVVHAPGCVASSSVARASAESDAQSRAGVHAQLWPLRALEEASEHG